MRAVVLHENGGPDKLSFERVPDPTPRPNECIVKVHASAVCGRDLVDRRGSVPMKRFPTILGHEFAGEIVAMGAVAESESGLRVGDRVLNLHRPACMNCTMCHARVPLLCDKAWQAFGHTVDGAYAELVAGHHGVLVKIPENLDYVPASTLMCTAGVALQALRARGRLEVGERVLITGASGGVGGAAVQLAKKMGAHVLATTTSEKKVPFVQKLGADEVIVSPDGHFTKDVRHRTSGGVDLAVDCVGPSTFDASVKSLRKGGRIVVVGNVEKVKIDLNLGALIMFGYEILGSASCTRRDLLDVLGLVGDGALVPQIDRTMPLEKAADAHRLLEDRAISGRIVLVP
ncbi:zinc-binding dehydrogenase [Myxococcota bacterium]|nr:zinc-binding dehydrogenase [Myxococcota bacterium]